MIFGFSVYAGIGSLMVLTGLAFTISALGIYIVLLWSISLISLGQLLVFPGRSREYARQCPLRRRQYVAAGIGSLLYWPILVVCGYLASVVSFWFVAGPVLGAVVFFLVLSPYEKRATAAGEPTWAQWKLLKAAKSQPQTGAGGESSHPSQES